MERLGRSDCLPRQERYAWYVATAWLDLRAAYKAGKACILPDCLSSLCWVYAHHSPAAMPSCTNRRWPAYSGRTSGKLWR